MFSIKICGIFELRFTKMYLLSIYILLKTSSIIVIDIKISFIIQYCFINSIASILWITLNVMKNVNELYFYVTFRWLKQYTFP